MLQHRGRAGRGHTREEFWDSLPWKAEGSREGKWNSPSLDVFRRRWEVALGAGVQVRCEGWVMVLEVASNPGIVGFCDFGVL